MSVYKRRSKWKYDFVLHGKRHQGYCTDPVTGTVSRNKREAEAFEEAMKVGLRSLVPPDRFPHAVSVYTLAQCFSEYLISIRHQANYHNAEDHIREFLSRPEFSPEKSVTDVSDANIESYTNWSMNQTIRVWIGGPDRERAISLHEQNGRPLWKNSSRIRSASTINHYLTTLATALYRCHRNRNPVTGVPYLPFMPRIKKLRSFERLPRPFSDETLSSLINIDGIKKVRTRSGSTKFIVKKQPPQYLIDAIMLCRLMGFRKNEVVGLTVDCIDMAAKGYRLPAEQTKSKRAEFIKAHPDAWRILVRLRTQAIDAGQQRLILARGPRGRSKDVPLRPIKSFRSAFDRLMSDLNLTGSHSFHSIKASFVTSISAVADAATTQKLARHVNYRTTQRYILVSDTRKSSAIEAMPYQVKAPSKIVAVPARSLTHHLFSLLACHVRRDPEEMLFR